MSLDAKDEPLRVVVAPPVSAAEHSSSVVDLRDVAYALWRGKWLVMLVTLIGLGYGLWKLHKAQPAYEASMVVLPGESGGGGKFGSAASNIAQSIGVSIGGEETTLFDRLEITLGSYALAKRLQDKYGLLQILYEGAWDPDTKTWRRPEGGSFERDQKIRAFFNQPLWQPPSIESLANYLGGAINVESIGKTEVKRLSLVHSDPELALYVLETAYQEAVKLVLDQDRQRIELERDYLVHQLERVSVQINREVLIKLLVDREQRLMLTQNEDGYVGQVIDPPRVPKSPLPVSKNQFVVVPTLIACLGSAFVITILFLFRSEDRSR